MADNAYLMKRLRLALKEKDKELVELRESIALELEQAAVDAMISDEYNFNDTAVRSKTFFLAAEIARGNNE